MPMLSKSQKQFLVDATTRYHNALPGSLGERYLASRGLLFPQIREKVDRFRLGYVADPLPGHEMMRGFLAIPYLRQSTADEWSEVSMRFRCIVDDCDHNARGHGKYMSNPGDTPRLFNTRALIESDDVISICEGEIDTITATVLGVPAVGVAGVEAWKPHFRDPFLGYERVNILQDGDEAGKKFATKLVKILPNSRVLPCDDREDVNSEYLKFGPRRLTERVNK